jgi:hypothetical protein
MFTFQTFQWRSDLCSLDGADAASLPFEEMLRRAVRILPPETVLFHTFYDICRDLGVPASFSPEVIREQCGLIFDRLDIVRSRKNVFASERHSRGLMGIPGGPEVFCLPGYSNAPLFRHESKMPRKASLYTPRAGCFYWGGCGAVGISRRSENQHEALLFAEYLLSESVQDTIWDFLRSAPVRKASLHTVDFAPQDELLAFLRQCRENPRSCPCPVGCAMAPDFASYLNGTAKREKIVERLLRFYE